MITWSITSMQSYPDTGVVVSADWRCVGELGEAKAEFGDKYVFAPPGKVFIPYDELTEAQVLSWIWATGVVNKSDIEAAVYKTLVSQVTPALVDAPLPW